MTAKLVVLLTKSEVTHGLIDALGMFKFVCFFVTGAGSSSELLQLDSITLCIYDAINKLFCQKITFLVILLQFRTIV